MLVFGHVNDGLDLEFANYVLNYTNICIIVFSVPNRPEYIDYVHICTVQFSCILFHRTITNVYGICHFNTAAFYVK